jgi:hypothetical protein
LGDLNILQSIFDGFIAQTKEVLKMPAMTEKQIELLSKLVKSHRLPLAKVSAEVSAKVSAEESA